MKLFVFNPEHDIALASNLEHFTPPQAACRIRRDLGFLPVLWAAEGDMILTDDKMAAEERAGRLGLACHGEFLTRDMLRQRLSSGVQPDAVCPWGWDLSLRNELLEYGIAPALLPDTSRLDAIRQMSHRRWAAENLLVPLCQISGTTGEAYTADCAAEVQSLLSRHGSVVLKAPWSSSGRGIRYVGKRHNHGRKSYETLSPQLQGWIRNVVNEQGCVMVEPWYDKAIDLGMEFYASADGRVSYRGLSLFHTVGGAYEGNLLGSETALLSRAGRYVRPDLLHEVAHQAETLLSSRLRNCYEGPLGIDMMAVRFKGELLLHPCVELNLRSTMGHVALALSRRKLMENKVMRITFSSDYQLIISSPSQP